MVNATFVCEINLAIGVVGGYWDDCLCSLWATGNDRRESKAILRRCQAKARRQEEWRRRSEGIRGRRRGGEAGGGGAEGRGGGEVPAQRVLVSAARFQSSCRRNEMSGWWTEHSVQRCFKESERR